MSDIDELIAHDALQWRDMIDNRFRDSEVRLSPTPFVRRHRWRTVGFVAAAVAILGGGGALTATELGSKQGHISAESSRQGDQSGTSTSCVPPKLSAFPNRVRAGQNVTIRGRDFFTNDCNDTASFGSTPLPRHPQAIVVLVLRSVGKQRILTAKATPATDGSFQIVIRVPASTPSGSLLLAPTGSQTTAVRILVRA